AIADQLGSSKPAASRMEMASRGLFLFTQGLAKKVVFADSFGAVADAGFAAVGQLSSIEAWAFSLAYTLQIYFDFSGYSDMAVGSAWILGFDRSEEHTSELQSRYDCVFRLLLEK